MHTCRFVLFLPLLSLSACAPAPLPPEALFRASTECALRECEIEERECRAEHQRLLDDCWIACASVGRCDVCLRNSDVVCNRCRYSSACHHRVNTFVVPNAVVLPLFESCEEYVAARSSCGDPVELSCAHHAGVERIEATYFYDCYRDAGCDPVARAACGDPAPTHGLMERVCGRLSRSCPSNGCDGPMANWLFTRDWWLRPDVIDGLRTCESLTVCGEYAACVGDWMRAVDGG